MRSIKVRVFVALFVCLFWTSVMVGQSLRQSYETANEHYKAGRMTEAIDTINNAFPEGGDTNPKVESLRALCYSAKKDFVKSKIALNRYFKMVPDGDSSTEAHLALIELRRTVDTELEKLDASQKTALLRERDAAANDAITSSSQAVREKKAASAVENDPLAELEMWGKVKSSSNAADYQAFLMRFPEGSFSKQAKTRMDNLGDPVWNETKKSSDPFKYRDYVNKYPNSPFVEQARQQMKELAAAQIAWEQVSESKDPDELFDFAKEHKDHPNAPIAFAKADELTWQNIKNSNNKSDYDRYIERFPEGKYIKEAYQRNPDRLRSLAAANPDSAIEEASKVLALDASNVTALRQRARAHYLNGNDSAGDTDASRILQLLGSPSNASEWEIRCAAESFLDKDKEALLSCTKAIELDATLVNAYTNRAALWQASRKFDNAITDFTKVIELTPRDPDGYAARAYVYYLKTKYTQALIDANEALAKDRSSERAIQVKGNILFAQSDYVGAMEQFATAIRLNPDNSYNYFRRGVVGWWYANKLPKWNRDETRNNAVKDFSSAITLNPDNSAAYYYRGWVYNELDRDDLAKADWKKYRDIEKMAKAKRKRDRQQQEEQEAQIKETQQQQGQEQKAAPIRQP